MQVETLGFAPKGGWPETSLSDSDQTLVIVFGGSGFVDDPAPMRALRQRFPTATIAGCSSSGEILGEAILDDSVVAAVAQFGATKLRRCTEPIDEVDSTEVGARLGRGLFTPELSGVLVFSDGLGVNGTELIRGLTAELPPDVIVTGGLAGDGDRFERTWVLDDEGIPKSGVVSAVGLYGDAVRIGHGSRGGWDAFGPVRIITSSENNVLLELDGRPALELYKEYLGERADGLPATGLLFPLAIRERANDQRQLVRTILSVDEETQSMTFAGDVPEGWTAQLMMANFDRLIDGASEAAQVARRSDENALSTLAIAISCVGRRLVLGERAEEEVEATLDGLPDASRLVGFYSYGELSPSVDGTCDLHNQTMTLTTIQEIG